MRLLAVDEPDAARPKLSLVSVRLVNALGNSHLLDDFPEAARLVNALENSHLLDELLEAARFLDFLPVTENLGQTLCSIVRELV